jgi:hypothetical protein
MKEVEKTTLNMVFRITKHQSKGDWKTDEAIIKEQLSSYVPLSLKMVKCHFILRHQRKHKIHGCFCVKFSISDGRERSRATYQKLQQCPQFNSCSRKRQNHHDYGKKKIVLELPGNNNTIPLYMDALFARSEMVRYLYDSSKKMMGDYGTYENRGWVLQKRVEAEIFGNNKVLTYSSYLMLFLFLQSFQLSTPAYLYHGIECVSSTI